MLRLNTSRIGAPSLSQHAGGAEAAGRRGVSTLAQHIAVANTLLSSYSSIDARSSARHPLSSETEPSSSISSSSSSSSSSTSIAAVANKYFVNGAAGRLDEWCPSAAKLSQWAVLQRETDSALSIKKRLILAALEEDIMLLKEERELKMRKKSENVVASDETAPSSSLSPPPPLQSRASVMWSDLVQACVWSDSEAKGFVDYYTRTSSASPSSSSSSGIERDQLAMAGGIVGKSRRGLKSDGSAFLEVIALYTDLMNAHGRRYVALSSSLAEAACDGVDAENGISSTVPIRVLEPPSMFMQRILSALPFVEATIDPAVLGAISIELLRLVEVAEKEQEGGGANGISSASSYPFRNDDAPRLSFADVFSALIAIINNAAAAKCSLHHLTAVQGSNTLSDAAKAVAQHTSRITTDDYFSNTLLRQQRNHSAADKANATTTTSGVQPTAATDVLYRQTTFISVFDDFKNAAKYFRRYDDHNRAGTTSSASAAVTPSTSLAEEGLSLLALSLELIRTHWRRGEERAGGAGSAPSDSTNTASDVNSTASKEEEGGNTSLPFSSTPQAKQCVIDTLTASVTIASHIGRASYYGYVTAATMKTSNKNNSTSNATNNSPTVLQFSKHLTPSPLTKRLSRLITAVGKDAVRYGEQEHVDANARLTALTEHIAGIRERSGGDATEKGLSFFMGGGNKSSNSGTDGGFNIAAEQGGGGGADGSGGGGGHTLEERVSNSRGEKIASLNALIADLDAHMHLARTATVAALCHFSTPTAVSAVVKERRQLGDHAAVGESSSPSKPIYQAIADDTVGDFMSLAKEWSVIHEPSVAAAILQLQETLLLVSGDIRIAGRGEGGGNATHTSSSSNTISTHVSPLIIVDPHGVPNSRKLMLLERAVSLVRTVTEQRPRVGAEDLTEGFKKSFQNAHRIAVELLTLMGCTSEAYLILVSHKHHGLSITKEVIRPLLYVLADEGDCRALNLIDITTLYCVNRVDIDCIAALFRMCEAANDHHRAKALLIVMRDVIPGFLSKVPIVVIRCLRNLQVLPKREAHLFMTPRELSSQHQSSEVGIVPDLSGGASNKNSDGGGRQ